MKITFIVAFFFSENAVSLFDLVIYSDFINVNLINFSLPLPTRHLPAQS